MTSGFQGHQSLAEELKYPAGSIRPAMEGRIINVRRLVALDITLHGPRFILAEFGIGTPAIFIVGFLAYEGGDPFHLGLYLLLSGFNYIPLLAYAIVIVRRGAANQEVESELARNRHYVRKYSIQQLLIFIPFSVVLLAVVQILRHEPPEGADALEGDLEKK